MKKPDIQAIQLLECTSLTINARDYGTESFQVLSSILSARIAGLKPEEIKIAIQMGLVMSDGKPEIPHALNSIIFE